MEIPRLSEKLRAALAEELTRFANQNNSEETEVSPEEAAARAMNQIAARVLAGEEGLFDPTNAGDNLALALGNMS